MEDRTFPLNPSLPRVPRALEYRRTLQRRRPVLNLILFLATLATTTMAGALHAGVDPFSHPSQITQGLSFSLPLLLILLCHEFGHYTLAAWHGIPTTLPYFIP